MRNCTNCSKELAKTTKGELCLICYRNRNNTSCTLNPSELQNVSNDLNIAVTQNHDGMPNDESKHENPEMIQKFNEDRNNGLINDDEKSIFDIIKGHMLRESQWNNETMQILKDEIIYLKSEIKHKNIMIENLINSNHCLISNNTLENTCYNKEDVVSIVNGNNTNDLNHHKVIISDDDSINNDEVGYKKIEADDVLFNDKNNEGITNNKKRVVNSRKVVTNNSSINKFVHRNSFNGLFVSDKSEYENTDEVDNRSMSENTRPFTQPNYGQLKQRNRPHIVTQKYPENNFVRKPIRPGVNQYNQAVKDGKTTIVFSTSMTKGIKVREFNGDYKTGTARFRRFPGAKVKQMQHYVLPTLLEDMPEVVLLQCGANDLPTTKINPTPVEIIAKEIIETGKLCENHGAKHILISSVITRKQSYMDRRKNEINDLLQEMCYDLGYIYINNDNINHEHLFYDGVHLTNEGSAILGHNYLHALNNLY